MARFTLHVGTNLLVIATIATATATVTTTAAAAASTLAAGVITVRTTSRCEEHQVADGNEVKSGCLVMRISIILIILLLYLLLLIISSSRNNCYKSSPSGKRRRTESLLFDRLCLSRRRRWDEK